MLILCAGGDGSLLLYDGPMIDGVILVARGGQIPLPALKRAKQKIDAHKLKCPGVKLNGVILVKQGGYYAKQYYQFFKLE